MAIVWGLISGSDCCIRWDSCFDDFQSQISFEAFKRVPGIDQKDCFSAILKKAETWRSTWIACSMPLYYSSHIYTIPPNSWRSPLTHFTTPLTILVFLRPSQCYLFEHQCNQTRRVQPIREILILHCFAEVDWGEFVWRQNSSLFPYIKTRCVMTANLLHGSTFNFRAIFFFKNRRINRQIPLI